MASEGEMAFANYWRWLATDLPLPIVEYRFDPTRRWRFDFAWENERVAVEIDGGQYMAHGGRHARDGDRDKHNRAALLGWRVIRFSPQQLSANPEAAIAIVRDALAYGR